MKDAADMGGAKKGSVGGMREAFRQKMDKRKRK